MIDVSHANSDRFSGFADLYDAHRPSPPLRLGALLCAYARCDTPVVVDVGSGTGLSTRWAKQWAAHVIGVEPSDDMRSQAEGRGDDIEYRHGTSTETGIADHSADIVVAVQAMHWMDPQPTHVEVGRILRPGGVFAAIDADWPPVTGIADAEAAWATMHARMRVLEARVAGGLTGHRLRAPIASDDPALADEDLVDPHRNRVIPGGVRSWSKSEHLAQMRTSGQYEFTREVVLDYTESARPDGGADLVSRFVAIMRSQGSYQGLRRAGLSDDDIGYTEFERTVAAVSGRSLDSITFNWRVRLGIRRHP